VYRAEVAADADADHAAAPRTDWRASSNPGSSAEVVGLKGREINGQIGCPGVTCLGGVIAQFSGYLRIFT
jgi:hypothetical protein